MSFESDDLEFSMDESFFGFDTEPTKLDLKRNFSNDDDTISVGLANEIQEKHRDHVIFTESTSNVSSEDDIFNKENNLNHVQPPPRDKSQSENKNKLAKRAGFSCENHTSFTSQLSQPSPAKSLNSFFKSKSVPMSPGSKPLLLQKRLRAAFTKAKQLGDPWEKFHIDTLPGQLATRYRYNVKKTKWVEDQVIVKMETEPFAHGAMRSCFRMKKLSTITSQDWKAAANYVAKTYIDPVEESIYFEDVKLQMDAKIWAEMYNRTGPPKQIDIFQMCVLRLRDSGQLFHLEHYIEGDYVKYNSNSGFVDENYRNTPHAFSHFTFEHSGHRLIVVDIQGVGDLYTDPQIHTSDGLGYGDGNLGAKGMALFFHSHICNTICKLLSLSKFDLSEKELAEIANNSSKCISPAMTVIKTARRSRTSLSMSSLSPTSEHFEKQFSFDSVPESPLRLRQNSENGFQVTSSDAASPPGGVPIPELRRTERQESESWEFSPESAGQDEHFEMFMRNHRPSTVHESEEVSRSLREAESDSVLGQIHLELAKYHELGRFSNEGEMDSDSALFHLEIASKLSNEEAIKALAQIHLQRDNDVLPSVKLEENDENTNKGISYMIQAAEKGDRDAQIFMAKAFETGFGLGTTRRKNWKEAVRFYEQAINSIETTTKDKSFDACSNEPVYKLMASLANLFHLGGFDLEKDPSQAGDLYNEAAEMAMGEFKGALASKYFELAEVAWGEMEEE